MILVPRGPAGTDQAEARRSETTQIVAAFVGALALVLFVAVPIGFAVHFAAMPIDYAALNALFVEETRGYLAPEPGERATYLAAILATLPGVLISIVLVRRFSNARGLRHRLAGLAGTSLVLLSIPFAAVFIRSQLMNYVLGGIAGSHDLAPASSLPSRLLLACGAIALAAIGTWSYSSAGKLPGGMYRRLAGCLRWTNLVLIAAILLTVLAARIRPASIVDGDGHFEAVFYSVSQVMAGKTLIADLPAQYGLYAELLRPLFAIIGISVLTFTIVMTVLQGIASFAVFRILTGLVRLAGLRLLAGLTLCWFTGSTWLAVYFSPIGHEYYQLWPIRVLFPGLLAFLFFAMRHRGVTLGRTAGIAALCGIAIVWNLDSGIPAAGALFAYLLVRAVFGKAQDRGRNIRLLAAGILSTGAVVAAFLVYLSIKAGGHIHLADWIKYQRIFYASGFAMLPMPRRPDPWMAVLGLYLFGIVGALSSHIRSRVSVGWDVILYLSILGLGLFTYYQGRSDAVVLTVIMWPAILIGFILADRTLRAVRARMLPLSASWSAVPIAAFGLMMSLLWLFAVPRLAGMTADEVRAVETYRNTSTSTAQNIAFIKARTGADRTATVIAPGQAVYFGETGLASDIPGPGIGEMMLIADQKRMLNQLREHPVAHLFIRLDANGKIPRLYLPLVSNYRLLDASAAGLQYLEPRDGKSAINNSREFKTHHG